jgi:cobalt-zinc-cadmium efflux system membrane fusion protein
MSDKTEVGHEEKTVNETATAPGSAVTRETRVEELKVERAAPRRTNRTAVVAAVAVVALAALVFLLWRTYGSGGGGGGRPVPAPRTVNVEQPGGAGGAGASTSEPTLTLTPEVAARAGIKVEPVGEQPAAESEGSAATGVVQSNAYRETPVVSLVGGIVRSVNAELGQNVRRGQAVAVVFSDELAAAQSRYLTAQAELEEHHKHHHRTAELVEIGAASREEFEQSESMLKKAEAEVASLRQRLLQLGLSPQRVDGLRSSSQISSEVSLPSPVSGTVINRSANPGEVVGANKEILRVADLSSVWIIGQVYEKDLGRIRVGRQVSYVDPRLDPATRTAQVRIELANPGQALKIGMYVGVAFATIGGSENTVPVVPASAVQNINNQQVVFVATNYPNVFVMRPVRVGPEAGGRVPVLEGLFVGERVVTEGSFLLRAEWLKLHPGGS